MNTEKRSADQTVNHTVHRTQSAIFNQLTIFQLSAVWWVESVCTCTCKRDGYNYVTLHKSLDTALCPRHVLLISDYSMDIEYDVYLLSCRNEVNGIVNTEKRSTDQTVNHTVHRTQSAIFQSPLLTPAQLLLRSLWLVRS